MEVAPGPDVQGDNRLMTAYNYTFSMTPLVLFEEYLDAAKITRADEKFRR